MRKEETQRNFDPNNAIDVQSIVYDLEARLWQQPRLNNVEEINEWLKTLPGMPENITLIDYYFSRTPPITANGFAFECSSGEVIVGIAGTNPRNGILSAQLLEDFSRYFVIASGGINPNGLYMRGLNNLILRNNVDTITGHSLAGSTASIAGMNHGIENTILFNPAMLMSGIPFPTRAGLARHIAMGTEILRLIENSEIKPTIFVTGSDWLQTVNRLTLGKKYGEIHIIPGEHDSPHASSNFLAENTRRFIASTFLRNGKFSDRSIDIKIGFGDEAIHVPSSMRRASNLLGAGQIKINPDSLRMASLRMRSDVSQRFEIASSGIGLINRANDDITSSRNRQVDRLVERNIELVNGLGLNNVFSSFNLTYNRIENDLPHFNRLLNSQLPSDMVSAFRNRHPSTNHQTTWHIDNNRPWNRTDMDARFQRIRTEIGSLIQILNCVNFEHHYRQTDNRDFSRRARSSIEQAYITNINRHAHLIRLGHRGIGNGRNNRSNAISIISGEILGNIASNISNARQKIDELAISIETIASNSENFDRQISRNFNAQQLTPNNQAVVNQVRLRFTHNNRLQQQEFLVKVMYEQADARMGEIRTNFRNIVRLIDESSCNVRNIISRAERVVNEINRWEAALTVRITSRTPQTSPKQLGGQQEIKTLFHFQLSEYIPIEIRNEINQSKRRLEQMIERFNKLQSNLRTFSNNSPQMVSNLKNELYELIYPRQQMQTKLKTLKTIAELLETTVSEYGRLGADLSGQMHGRAITGFINETTELTRYLRKIIAEIRTSFCMTLS